MKKTLIPVMKNLMLMTLLFSASELMAQNINPVFTPDIPPSPQAVAFNRLGDYKVNNNYGAPDISIPLFEIDHYGYKIPLSLHYEASPMKPGYNYDVTGMGWTLSGNSCVSRTIKDVADEYGLYHRPFELTTFDDSSGQLKRYRYYYDKLGKLNFQYDRYEIVLPTGRTIPFFMYKKNGVMTYKLLPNDSNVKITCSYGTNSIDSFIVTDESGINYWFTVADKATNGFDNDINADQNVTWLLTRIDFLEKGSITYEYNDEINIHTQNNISEPTYRVSRLVSQMLEDWPQKKFDVGLTYQDHSPRYKMRFLKRISYGPTKVDFNYYTDNRHMKEIVVSESNETIKKFSFEISDMFLTSLVFSGTNNEDKLEYGFVYQNMSMNLNDTIVRYTDYWGNLCYSKNNSDLGNFNMYFNNEEDGSFLNQQQLKEQIALSNIARIIDNKEDDPYYYYKVKLQSAANGDSRQPTAPEYHGVLSSITYPNGGYTIFTWENHRFPTATAADGDMVFDRRQQRIIQGGGFRIKSIKNYLADGTIASEEHYRYGFTYGDILQRNFPLPLPDTYNTNDHIGCGEAVVDPNVLTFMTFSYFKTDYAPFDPFRQFQMMTVGRNSAVRQMVNPQGSATWWDAFFSADTFRSILGGRHPVVYPEITVYHGDPDVPTKCNSKTVYKYDIYSYQHDPYTYYMSTFNQGALPDTAYFEGLFYQGFRDAPRLVNDNYDAPKRHQLKSKCNYSFNSSNGTWELASEEKFFYAEERICNSDYSFDTYMSIVYRSNYVGALGNDPWLGEYNLVDFYAMSNHWLGKSMMTRKTTTTLRQGGMRSEANTQKETFQYQYPEVLKTRQYTDFNIAIKKDYIDSLDYDKVEQYSYVGEVNADIFAGQENPDSIAHLLAEMRSYNMLASMTSFETFTKIPQDSLIYGNKITYKKYGSKILPFKLYQNNGNVYEESIAVLSYGVHSNPTEIVDLKTGIHSVFLWDDYGRYLTAMIRNATMTQIQSVISQLSGSDSKVRHATLQTLLPDAQIQTWDYLPLIGVSSHTDVSGETHIYDYDGLGRLKSEKRVVNGQSELEILHKYEYNFMNQQY